MLAASRNTSAIKIQGLVRGWLARTKIRKMVELEFVETFPELGDTAGVDVGKRLKPSLETYKAARKFMYFVGRKNVDQFEVVLRYIISSLDSDSPKTSYIGVFLNKSHSVAWIEHIKQLCSQTSQVLASLSTDHPAYSRKAAFFVLVLISFTSTNTWRILKSPALSSLAPHMTSICHTVTGHLVQTGLMTNLQQLLLTGLASSKVSLSRTTLSAVMTLAIRPVMYGSYSDQLVSLYLLHILSVPGACCLH